MSSFYLIGWETCNTKFKVRRTTCEFFLRTKINNMVEAREKNSEIVRRAGVTFLCKCNFISAQRKIFLPYETFNRKLDCPSVINKCIRFSTL